MLNALHLMNTLIASGSAAAEIPSPKDVVMHHLTDHVINSGFISTINEKFLSTKLFGMFDMRITRWLLMIWIVAFLMLIVFIPLAQHVKRAPKGSKSRWVNMWEALICFVRDDIVVPNLGEHAEKKAMPFFCTLFFFILFANVIGLIPGLSSAMGNLGVTAALALVTITSMIAIGFINQGPLYIVTGIVPKGIPVFIFPLLWVIELMGFVIKPLSLAIRLFANMLAGHAVIIVFIFLVMLFQSYFVGVGSVLGSLFMYLIDILVAFIQAYIFSMLTAMYWGMAVHSH